MHPCVTVSFPDHNPGFEYGNETLHMTVLSEGFYDIKISLVLWFICRVEFRRELKVKRDRAIKMERLATVPYKVAHTLLTRNSPSTDTTQVSS